MTRPQMVSTERPNVFFLMARFISLNSAEFGFSIFAAIETFALFSTDSDASAVELDGETWIRVVGGAALATLMLPRFFSDGFSSALLSDLAAVAGLAFAIKGSGPRAAGLAAAG
ncbi:hypothetical protein [Bradyrhizobium sp. UFLA05-112]